MQSRFHSRDARVRALRCPTARSRGFALSFRRAAARRHRRPEGDDHAARRAGPGGADSRLVLAGAAIAAFSGSYDATNYPPTRLIDGDPSTLPWLTPNGVTQGWVKITLSNGDPRMIDRIRLQPRQGGQKVKDFQVAVSATGTDDADFVTVLTATAADNENLQTFLLPYPMPAKHLLYRVLRNRANGNSSGSGGPSAGPAAHLHWARRMSGTRPS